MEVVKSTRGPVVRKPKARLHKQGASHLYGAYGLCLSSCWQLPLPEVKGLQSALAQVKLSQGPVALFRAVSWESTRQPRGDGWFRHIQLADGSDYLRWSGLFEFHVSSDGRRIACRELNGSSYESFHVYLLGQVLSFALLKQGIEPLHSTTVVIKGEAVAFLGDSGYGKSSLGAAFLQAGCRLLTDDLLVLKEDGDRFLAYPGPPRIKLFPEIAKNLIGRRNASRRMNKDVPKLVIPLRRNETVVPQDTFPLKALYVLTPPPTRSYNHRITIQPLSSKRAFLELLKNTFNTVVLEAQRLKRQFDLATRLATRVPVKSLSYPRDLRRISEVRESILREVEG